MTSRNVLRKGGESFARLCTRSVKGEHCLERNNEPSGSSLTRRRLLQLGAASALGLAVSRPIVSFSASPSLALRLAQLLNRTRFGDLPVKAIEHAKVLIASTLASAAPGSLIDSARIVRDIAKDRGGKAEATVWFDGAKLPLDQVARV